MIRLHNLALSLALLGAAPLIAQTPRSGTDGLNLGIGLNGSSIQRDDSDFGTGDPESGGGLNMHVGYNFTPNVGLLLNAAAATMTDDDNGWNLGHADLAFRYTFANPNGIVIPYLEAGFTVVVASDQMNGENVELSGTGVAGGGGLNIFMTRTLALDISLWATRAEFTTVRVNNVSVTVDDGVGVSGGRFNVGVSWYPQSDND